MAARRGAWSAWAWDGALIRRSLVHPAPLVIDDGFAILLVESAVLLLGQQVQHRFGRPAQTHAERGYDDGPVDEDGMRHHGVE